MLRKEQVIPPFPEHPAHPRAAFVSGATPSGTSKGEWGWNLRRDPTPMSDVRERPYRLAA
jgi:hypothetical protein